MRGVSAIQQNQVRLNGAKQLVYNSPLQIAASQGQARNAFDDKLTGIDHSAVTRHPFASNPRDDRVFLRLAP